MVLVSTQPLTEMSTRNLPRDKGRPAGKADNLTANCVKNVGASTSHNPIVLHGLLQEWLYLSFYNPEDNTLHSCENHKHFYRDMKSVQNTTTGSCFDSK
jgi:hypothetical protein